MVLNYKQALWAAYTLLDDLYDQTKSNPLRELLSDMNPFLFVERTPIDPATWFEWVNCATAIQGNGYLTDAAIFEALASFLNYNEEEYGYKSALIIKELQSPVYQKRWGELLEKVSTYPDA